MGPNGVYKNRTQTEKDTEIMKQEIETLKQEIVKLTDKVETILNILRYGPESQGFIEARQHFEEIRNNH